MLAKKLNSPRFAERPSARNAFIPDNYRVVAAFAGIARQRSISSTSTTEISSAKINTRRAYRLVGTTAYYRMNWETRRIRGRLPILKR